MLKAFAGIPPREAFVRESVIDRASGHASESCWIGGVMQNNPAMLSAAGPSGSVHRAIQNCKIPLSESFVEEYLTIVSISLV